MRGGTEPRSPARLYGNLVTCRNSSGSEGNTSTCKPVVAVELGSTSSRTSTLVTSRRRRDGHRVQCLSSLPGPVGEESSSSCMEPSTSADSGSGGHGLCFLTLAFLPAPSKLEKWHLQGRGGTLMCQWPACRGKGDPDVSVACLRGPFLHQLLRSPT